MTARKKIALAGVVLLALSILLLPRLAHRIDSSVDSVWQATAALESQYRDMTNAYPIASEVLRDHPTHRVWEERRAALLKSSYIETREFPMQNRLAAKGAAQAFFAAFQSRFPGVECTVRGANSDKALATITARKTDFGPLGSIEWSIRQYENPPEKSKP